MRSIHSSLSLVLLAGALAAQGPLVLDAPRVLLDPLHLKSGTVQSLQLPLSSDGPFRVTVVLGQQRHTLLLHPYDVYAPGATLVNIDEGGAVTESPLPPSNTFRGVVSGVADSIVAANLYHGQLTAIIGMPGVGWSVEPATDALPGLPHTAHVVYRHDEMRPIDGFCDAVPTLPPGVPGTLQVGPGGDAGTANAAVKTLGYTPEITASYRNVLGGSANAINRVTQIANAMGAIYVSQTVFSAVNIIKIVNSEVSLSTSAGTALSQFRNIWLNRTELRRVTDVAQGFVSTLGGNTIGIAYISGACGSNRVSVVQNFGNATQRAGLSAHEVGHNLSAQHCSGSGCFIMCSVIGGCGGNLTLFGTTSRNAINNFVNPRTCFDN
jgi:hypothetical protein